MERWRIQVPADLSIVVYAENRDEVKRKLYDIVFTHLELPNHGITQLEVTDFYDDEFFIDPEPLCKCGNLPECCDCEDDDE